MGRKLQKKCFDVKRKTTRQRYTSRFPQNTEAVGHSCGVLGVQPGDILLLWEYPIAA
jgi:hypothetical protein